MHILYLTHDITDPTTTKRVRMLLAGGATVIIAGFSRKEPPLQIEDCHVIDLGTTHDGKFTQRVLSVITTMLQFKQHRNKLVGVDVILARNMEMLAIARKARKFVPAPIVYEVLDIHRLLAGKNIVGTYLSWLEAWLRRSAALIITSSPAFISEYLEPSTSRKYPIILLENKVFGTPVPEPITRPAGPPWRIGWFGALRCAKSFAILCDVAAANPGLVEVVLRGKPAYDQIPEFDERVKEAPGVTYLGPYANPDDLAAIYSDVHFSWAIDMFEEGFNSAWLLPNRLYEGGLYGTVPLAASSVETSRFIAHLGIGRILAEPKEQTLTNFLKSLTPESYQQMADAVNAVPKSTWLATPKDCAELIKQFSTYVEHPRTDAVARMRISPATPALVVIPCLNEHVTIVKLVKQLYADSKGRPMTIVIADGGSTDGTIELIRELEKNHSNVHYLHNRKRIQSAAINLAVQTYGQGHGYLIRIDAHAHYPAGYCATLITEANRVAADSVVVSMRTVGESSAFQQAVAAAQNSRIGNGGSAHRNVVGEGKWVDHGHHALMRIDTYRSVGGYDESFTHNEDAELDLRLTRAGRHIWLTGATTLDYTPRSDMVSLFRQYYKYGQGRARTMKKHRMLPRLRQLLPIGVLPALLLMFTHGFFASLALLFLILWACLCLFTGIALAAKAKNFSLVMSGHAAMLMHTAWSIGFWQGLLIPRKKRA